MSKQSTDRKTLSKVVTIWKQNTRRSYASIKHTLSRVKALQRVFKLKEEIDILRSDCSYSYGANICYK
jgi:hypothetical protein